MFCAVVVVRYKSASKCFKVENISKYFSSLKSALSTIFGVLSMSFHSKKLLIILFFSSRIGMCSHSPVLMNTCGLVHVTERQSLRYWGPEPYKAL